MRATWPGARSGRISITTLPLVVSRVSVSSGLAIRNSLRDDRRLLHVIHAREALGEIGIAFCLKAALVGAAPARRTLAVFSINGIHHVHAGHDLAEGGKAHAVELTVIGEVDEHLRGARIGT